MEYNVSTLFADLRPAPPRMVEAPRRRGDDRGIPGPIPHPFPTQLAGKGDPVAAGHRPAPGKTLGFAIPMMVRNLNKPEAHQSRPDSCWYQPRELGRRQVQARPSLPLGQRAQWRFIQAILRRAHRSPPQIQLPSQGRFGGRRHAGDACLDIIEKGYCDLSNVEVCVIDEADRELADLGFMPDRAQESSILTRQTRQTMPVVGGRSTGDVNELIRRLT